MRALLLVAIGSGIGGVLRFLLATRLQPPSALFPAGTLSVNLLGCLLIGALGAWFSRGPGTPWHTDARTLLMTGVLGGFTTFSTFALETLTLLQAQRPGLALLYALLSNLGGLLLAWLGFVCTGALLRAQ